MKIYSVFEMGSGLCFHEVVSTSSPDDAGENSSAMLELEVAHVAKGDAQVSHLQTS
jgi:hypothetical protein